MKFNEIYPPSNSIVFATMMLGFYRPAGVSQFSRNPCSRCKCHSPGAKGVDICYPDSELAHQGHEAGDCVCREGFTGPNCDQCAVGYRDYPHCKPCPCSLAGTIGGKHAFPS